MVLQDQDEQWKAVLEGSMFEDHFDELQKICQEAYGGNSELFDNEFLRPMCLLLQELKTGAEVCVLSNFYVYFLSLSDKVLSFESLMILLYIYIILFFIIHLDIQNDVFVLLFLQPLGIPFAE